MKPKALFATLMVAAFAAGIVCYYSFVSKRAGVPAGGNSSSGLAENTGAGIVAKHTGEADASEKSPLHRLEEWKVLADNVKAGVANHEQVEALADLCARELLCCDEMVRLQKYLEDIGMWHARDMINEKLSGILTGKSDLSTTARSRLTSMEDLNSQQQWCYAAGEGCDGEEIVKLQASLKSPSSILNAKFGHCKALASTDPLQAARNALELIKSGPVTGYTSSVLLDIVKSAPATADFAAMEVLLAPAGRRDADPRYAAQWELLSTWAGVDPAGAANHIVMNSTRITPELIRPVVRSVISRNLSSGVDWVQDFPPGEYRDQAILEAVSVIQNQFPQESMDLINQMTDPGLKEQSLSKFYKIGESRGK